MTSNSNFSHLNVFDLMTF